MPQSNASLVSKKTSVTNFDFLVENMPNICFLRTQTRFFSFVSSSFNFAWFTFAFPELTFSKVEEYAQKESGRRHTTKGYKFLLSPDILHYVKDDFSYSKKINSKCWDGIWKWCVYMSPARQAYFIGCVGSLQANHLWSGGKNKGTKSE